MRTKLLPKKYQKAKPSAIIDMPHFPEDALFLDVLFVGGGVSGLLGAISLAKNHQQEKKKNPALKDIEIGVLDKASAPGEHNLSGAVINPRVLYEVFGEKTNFPFRHKVESDRLLYLTKKRGLPLLSPFNWGHKELQVVSICELIRFLAAEAEALGVHLLYGYPASALLTKEGRLAGVMTQDKNRSREGLEGPGFEAGVPIETSLTILAEGSCGHLTQSYLNWKNIKSKRPQTYALGVKEVWQSPNPPKKATHTMGWPLKNDEFGGSFLYPMGKDKLCVGFVAGLDSPHADLDVHSKLQHLKDHPYFKPHFEGGTLLEWGAKTLPEGGYYSLPSQLSGDRVLIVGDAAGFINMSNLKGVHYSMESARLASEVALQALKKEDFSAQQLKAYDEKLKNSFILKELYKVRNFRHAFHGGFWKGFASAAIMTLTGGRWPHLSDKNFQRKDNEVMKQLPESWPLPPSHHIKKTDAVYLSKNKTRDDIPSHLIVDPSSIPEPVGRFYEALCPAGVYEWKDGQLIVNAPNCVDCKATEVLGPGWTPREGGSGPSYQES